MPTNAIQKLQAEITASNNDAYTKVIGEYLILHLGKNHQDADKILAADKTIAKSIDAMATAAKAKQKNGRAMLTDPEAYAIVLNYFGIDGQASAVASKVDDIKLDDLF
jgi:hypothetical protein